MFLFLICYQHVLTGFGSARNFNELFKKRYHLSPTALKKQYSKTKKTQDHITLALGYRPPYLWEQMLGFLDQRAIPGVEVVANNEYLRSVHLCTVDKKHLYGWIKVGHLPKKNALSITMSETLLPVIPQILARVKHLFDLHCDPDIIYQTLLR